MRRVLSDLVRTALCRVLLWALQPEQTRVTVHVNGDQIDERVVRVRGEH